MRHQNLYSNMKHPMGISNLGFKNLTGSRILNI